MGLDEGEALGFLVGAADGLDDGRDVGKVLGPCDGETVGLDDGVIVGDAEGINVGLLDGELLGCWLGALDGPALGTIVLPSSGACCRRKSSIFVTPNR